LQGIILRWMNPVCVSQAYPKTSAAVIAGCISGAVMLLGWFLSFRSFKEAKGRRARD